MLPAQKNQEPLEIEADPASFRDPSGYIFFRDGQPYRWISPQFREEFEAFQISGLYDELIAAGLLINHREIHDRNLNQKGAFKILAPDKIPFIAYPHEFCFSQLKDAALLTLELVQRAIDRGLILKDATAYNVQFVNGKPAFIDLLSFERYEEGKPWVAYKQFCQHFLAPLALMSYVDVSLGKLMSSFIDGIPLEVASKTLPFRSRFNLGLFLHIHLHSKTQKQFSDKALSDSKRPETQMTKTALLGLVDGLKTTVQKLTWRAQGTEWADYYSSTNYSNEAMSTKASLVRKFIREVGPKSVWDLGANTGTFSHIASEEGASVVAFDIDPAAVERHYLFVKENQKRNLLPLLLDLTNPTGGFGWGERERQSLSQRGPCDLCMALAVIHHLSISNNVPLEKVSEYFASLGKNLIIEFVPKSDSRVQRLLRTREDIFPHYTEQGFEEAFQLHFEIVRKERIADSERTLYRMIARAD